MSYHQRPVGGTNTMAIVSLIVSIIGLCSPLGILGLIFGYVARRQIEEGNETGSGMATAGIVMGWISVGFSVLLCMGILGGGGYS